MNDLRGLFKTKSATIKYLYKILKLLITENGKYQPSKRVWKKVESQGKVSEKSGNFNMDIEWQPCNGERMWAKYCLPASGRLAQEQCG